MLDMSQEELLPSHVHLVWLNSISREEEDTMLPGQLCEQLDKLQQNAVTQKGLGHRYEMG